MTEVKLARDWIGWIGRDVLYSRAEARGALMNGTRIVKLFSDDASDRHKPGDKGRVVGSEKLDAAVEHGYFYFVEWDDMPGTPVGVVGSKIAECGE